MSSRKSMCLRIPLGVYDALMCMAKERNQSFNSLVIEILERDLGIESSEPATARQRHKERCDEAFNYFPRGEA